MPSDILDFGQPPGGGHVVPCFLMLFSCYSRAGHAVPDTLFPGLVPFPFGKELALQNLAAAHRVDQGGSTKAAQWAGHGPQVEGNQAMTNG